MSGLTLGELAVRFGCTLHGNPDDRVTHIAGLPQAGPGALTFVANVKYQRQLPATRAGAVVLEPALASECPVPALVCANPYATFARIATLLHPPPTIEPGVHATAVVAPDAKLDASASVGAHCVVDAGVRIGARVVLGPGCIVLRDANIGDDSRLVARVTVCERVVVGTRCILHPGVVIGADGFGNANDKGAWIKVPQVGSVRIGNDVEVGANTTVDRGAIDDTVIDDGVRMDNQIQIGHNVHVGAHTAIAACVGIAGSTIIGKRCMLGGAVGIAGQLTLCDDVVVLGGTAVIGSILKPGVYAGTIGADEARDFRRNAVRFRQLDAIARQVRRLSGERTPSEEE
jgi:UDP-3-O-[3-hydroxymyristoyl] glucosamine N-acyltransferase